MGTANLATVNFSGGELSPLIYGRNDLPLNKRGLEWQKNIYSFAQGCSRFRNGWMWAHNTKNNEPGKLLKFEFNNEDTYVLVAHDKMMRVLRNDAPVVEAAKNISAVTKADPAQVTITGHGYSVGDEIFIDNVNGMTDINDQFFNVKSVVDANNITLESTLGVSLDSTNFQTYTSGGTASKVFETPLPFAYDDLADLHYTQNNDTILTARHGYPPFFITRLDHDEWYVTAAQMSSPAVITAVTKASPGVFTTRDEHGLAVDDYVYIANISGMTNFNGGFFQVNSVPDTTSFSVKNTYGTAIDTTSYSTYTSGGVAFKMDFRNNDPFGQRIISDITLANPGVFTTTADHGLKVNDEIYFYGVKGTSELNDTKWFVKTVPSTTTFTVSSTVGGAELNTSSGYTAWFSGGSVTPLKKVPGTVTTIQEARLGYGNLPTEPDFFIFSRSPDASTGVQRYQDFELGADDTHAVKGNLAAIFGTMEAIQWMSTVGDELVVGTTGSIRRLVGKEGNGFLTPSNAKAPAVNNVGASKAQPISNGRTIYYIQDNQKKVRNFIFEFASDGYNTVDINLVTDNLTEGGLLQVEEHRGTPDIMWAVRSDGLLCGLTFQEAEQIFAWHRHAVAGRSRDDSGRLQPWAKVLSVVVVPRPNNSARLWAIIEREYTVGNDTYTSRTVEYLSERVSYESLYDFISGEGYEAQAADILKWQNSRLEAIKDDCYLDSAIKYDGRLVPGSVKLTPGATTGDSVTFNADSSFFTSDMVGRRLIKTYSKWGDGGGIAEITAYTSGTQVTCKILSGFDSVEQIAAGQWIITTDTIRGLNMFNGRSVRVQEDGADGGTFTVTDGAITLPRQAGVIHVGLPYSGLWATTNMDYVGARGSTQAKIRRVIRSYLRLYATAGLKVGTTPWNVKAIVLRQNDDLTDTLNPLFDGIVDAELSDGHTRQSKQICVVKDDPTPMMILSADSEVEVVNA